MNYETAIDSEPDTMHESEESHGRRNKRGWIILGVIAAVLVLGVLAYILSGGGKETAPAAGEEAAGGEQAPVVTVISPGTETVTRAINATGTLAARHEVPVGIVGEGGRVVRVYVNAGDWVKQGQTLASVDRSVQNQQVEGLRAQVSVAQSSLDLAVAQLGRAQQLVERGFISQADIDRLTAERDGAQARLRVARASVNEALARNSRLSVTAPTSGYILERSVEPGQTVTQGSGTLFRLAAGGEMELQAQVSETELSGLSVGVPATVTPVGTSEDFTGQVWQISPIIDPQSRQGTARIALSYDRALRPGGFANASIRAGATSAPVLPDSAVQSDDKGSFVFIVGKGNKVERRDVATGTVTSKGLTITEGLDGTERVVLYAGGFLSAGETVRPKAQKRQASK